MGFRCWVCIRLHVQELSGLQKLYYSRRICPGMPVAEKELFLAISRLLWAFKIQSVPGETICLDEYEGNSGRTPLPFKVNLVPRDEHVRSILEAAEEKLDI